MLQRIFPPLLWSAAHFSLVYVNKASEQEAIGHGSSEASKPSFSHLNVSQLLFVSNMESPDRRKLSLFCWFNTPVAAGHAQWHTGNAAQRGEAPAAREQRRQQCRAPIPSSKYSPQGQGEASNLLGFCLEECVLNALSIPYHASLLVLSRVDNYS